jgi:hypothetical protein
MRRRVMFVLLPLAGLMIASCAIQSGGLGEYYAPGTSYNYNRLNPDDFTGHGHEGGGHCPC